MRKYRISTHGTIHSWWCVQERRFLIWKMIAPYIEDFEEAKKIVKSLEESDR